MAVVDVILLAVLAASVLLGVWRGLLYEVLSVLAWVVAFVVAQRWALAVAGWLPLQGWSDPLRYGAGFALTFVVVAFVGGWVAALARRGAEATGVRPVDRVLGGVFGLLRGGLILAGVALLVHQTPWADSAAWREAVGPRWLTQGLLAVKVLVPAEVAVYFP
ncbi:CvpA family protein [Tepidimonas taiwanensis]|uniref:Colicin V production protein n=1 Tax=Tepidimonas taiwanensis TaxID=307486 RepID=A0A554XD17_9BURK|nr:CvpA family protein [Tepidimonas taiwanensis]MCX7692048.1 CvpA family protein [Tepidimonas taiwanensis]MDM7464316.1 CvpA family protein [Tepidimonas taiwanensis]TSE33726.1 Colicin V production protein [Tepidimonas taiwanensis]UBQ06725.1 CvpA family protein [Tepidimonas taiwanensis]